MAVPEAVSAGEAAGARVIQGRATTVREERIRRPRGARATRGATRAARTYGPQAAASYAGTAKGAARQAANARIPGDRSYQPVILAEFLIAVVLVAFTPIATGGSPNAKAKQSPSPYDTGDLRQLVAVGAVYFVLSLISSGNRGRISAWLGGLIVIGIGMSKLSKGQLGALVQGITGQQVKPANPADQQGWATDPFGNAPGTSTGGGGHDVAQ